jgi:hypothetical protein
MNRIFFMCIVLALVLSVAMQGLAKAQAAAAQCWTIETQERSSK